VVIIHIYNEITDKSILFLFVKYIMQAFLAEFVGVAVFVLVILFTGHPIAIGLALTLIIYAVRGMSGGHINPAVSVAMASLNKISMPTLAGYVVAQTLGALLAVFLFKMMK
jgi:glycerol uptake facilitator-like aquaporin